MRFLQSAITPQTPPAWSARSKFRCHGPYTTHLHRLKMDIKVFCQCIDSLFFRLHSLQDLRLPFHVSLDDILDSRQISHDVLAVFIEQEHRNYESSDEHASPVLTGPEIHDLVVFAPKFEFGEGVRSFPLVLGICTELEEPELLAAFCGQRIVLCQPHFPRPDRWKRSTFFQ